MNAKRLRDAEETKIKLELKRRFKKVIRLIIINSHWIERENDEDKFKKLFNPRDDVRFLVRTTQKSELFTAGDKSLLLTPHAIRSTADRDKLIKLFANLKCFRDLPPLLRARLVPVIQFMSINAERRLIKEGDVPHTVIFIVAGNIEMSTIKKSGGGIMFGPGDYIGDVELNEYCDRTHTFTAKSQCELLILFEDDYFKILGPYMKKIWNDKKRALKALDYFNFLNDDQILKTCKMSSLKQFKPLDTIYSRDKGTLNNVHFVLSGECVILQCLNMKVSKSHGKKIYELDDTVVESISADSDFDVKDTEDINSEIQIELTEDELNKRKKLGKMNLEQIELACGMIKNNKNTASMQSRNTSDEDSNYFSEEFAVNPRKYSVSSLSSRELKMQDSDETTTTETAFETDTSEKSNKSKNYHSPLLHFPLFENVTFESRFIDVGSITFGGIFGLGEKSQHRVIMARSVVQCLMIPRFFLMDHELNPGNVWQRRIFYLNCIMPTREMLFNDFLQNLEWRKFKTNYIKKTVKTSNNDFADIEDIPILCRIEEGIV